MQRRTNTKKDNAVSPVVGVMLMLVVTIIIAAVVSMSASGLLSNEKSTPSLSATAALSTSNGLVFTTTSTSEPVSPSDLQITMSMQKDGDYLSRVLEPGAQTPLVSGTALTFANAKSLRTSKESATQDVTNITELTELDANWNKTILNYAKPNAWENTSNYAEGVVNWTYIAPDGTTSILKDYQSPISAWTKVNLKRVYKDNNGKDPITEMHADHFWNWMVEMNEAYDLEKQTGKITKFDIYTLKPGDKVDINVVYLPSGKPVFSKTITVGA